MNVKQLDPKDLTEKHVEFLCKFCESTKFGVEPKHVIARAMAGQQQLWEPQGSAVRGIFITELVQHPAGKEFRIYGVAGENVLTHAKTLLEVTRSLARKCGCKFIGTESDNPRLSHLYESIGLKPVSTQHLMEL